MNRPHARAVLALISVLPLAAACSKHTASEAPAATTQPVATPEPPPPAADPAADAKKMFSTRCVVCHGDHGAGDGPGAAALTPKPRAFSDATWQASVTDEQIGKTIVEGGAAVGKSAAMAANPDLADKPDEVKELVKIVRAFKH
ncbi:MAG TPA: c-type cytochrome [Polyangiaceae bacterium]|nr:c-type cytochrome [Polyangiaceae bacterium]